jgi:hypothetical protein
MPLLRSGRRQAPRRADLGPRTTARQRPAIANAAYDHTGGMVEWIAIRKIAKRALGRNDQPTEDAVAKAIAAIYDAGKPITLQTVGQNLEEPPGAPPRP